MSKRTYASIFGGVEVEANSLQKSSVLGAFDPDVPVETLYGIAKRLNISLDEAEGKLTEAIVSGILNSFPLSDSNNIVVFFTPQAHEILKSQRSSKGDDKPNGEISSLATEIQALQTMLGKFRMMNKSLRTKRNVQQQTSNSSLEKEKIEVLHTYNETKDMAHVWLGRLAEMKGQTVVSLYDEFGITEDDEHMHS